MRKLCALLAIVMALAGCGCAQSESEETLLREVRALYPDWCEPVIVDLWSDDGRTWQYDVALLRVEEHRLETCVLTVPKEPGSDANAWQGSLYAPIPLTDEAAERFSALLAEDAVSFTQELWDYGLLLTGETLDGCAGFLLGDGEELIKLLIDQEWLAAVVSGDEGYRLLVAAWDGSAFGETASSPAQEWEFSIDGYGSGRDAIGLNTVHGDLDLERGDDGIWRLIVYGPSGWSEDEEDEDWDEEVFLPIYLIVPEGLVRFAEINWYDPSNDAWHYGTPTFPTALDDLVFSDIPALAEAIPLMDASSWACVRQEGAEMYTAPGGDVIADCFARLAGVILGEESGWTKLRVGSEKEGLEGWFRTEDLAFGGEIEEVRCAFPGYDPDVLSEPELMEALGDRETQTEFWLIGSIGGEDWLVQTELGRVTTLSGTLIGETWPTEHHWTGKWYEEPYLEED